MQYGKYMAVGRCSLHAEIALAVIGNVRYFCAELNL